MRAQLRGLAQRNAFAKFKRTDDCIAAHTDADGRIHVEALVDRLRTLAKSEDFAV